MATFVKLPSGSWRAVVRRKGVYISETFHQREDARRWATAPSGPSTKARRPKTTRIADKKTFGHLIDLHIADLKSVAKPIGRTKLEAAELLKPILGEEEISPNSIAEGHRLRRAAQRSGAGPVTVGMYIGYDQDRPDPTPTRP
jgi:hypothetical protein